MACLCAIYGMELDRGLERKWFRCSSAFLMTRLNLSKRAHERLMATFSKKGWISRKMMGNPAKRHVRINFKRLESDL